MKGSLISESLLPISLRLSETNSSPESLDFMESISQAVVYSVNASPDILCVLGQSQQLQFDKNPKFDRDRSKVEEARVTFTLSIDAEEGPITQSKLESQTWWKDISSWNMHLDKLEAARKAGATKPSMIGKGDSKKTAIASKAGAQTPSKMAAVPAKTGTAVKPVPVKTSSKTEPVKPATAANKTSAAATAPKSEANTKKSDISSSVKKATVAPAAAAKNTPLQSKGVVSLPNSTGEKNAEPQGKPNVVLTPPTVPSNRKRLHASRIGLARVLSRILLLSEDAKPTIPTSELIPDIIKWYKEVISMRPEFHDAYIELGSLCEKYDTPKSAIDVYSSFPFSSSGIPTQDDLYLHGEISRLMMKEKMFKDPRLISSLIAEGKVMGMRSLSKYTDILDKANESKVLMEVYCGVNGKPATDPEMVSFFKSRFWI
jgi:hypothetical protein